MTAAAHILTILAVEDLARAAKFYASAFGWQRVVDAPVYVEFALPAGMRLGLYERRGFARNTGVLPAPQPVAGTTATEMYFHVDDLAAAVERLTNAGARMLSPPALREWGDEAAYFADTDGNVIALARPDVRTTA